MGKSVTCDMCVIGGGSGGLSVAAGASGMGARVVLIEKGAMGGDCLNTGCVPSKALLAAAHCAQTMRKADLFGITGHEPSIDMAKVRDHVRDVIAGIAPHDSVERFEGLGVQVIQETVRFTGPRTVVAGDTEVTARFFVIATGSSPFVPPIPGLDRVTFFTNETIFDIAEPIAHLIVVGGGPIGLELAQAHRRLGAEVTVLEMAEILPKDDREAVQVVRQSLIAEGIRLHESATVTAVEPMPDGGIHVAVREGKGERKISGSHLLIAAGRAANVRELDLDQAGVVCDRSGVSVGSDLRTTNPRIYAVGDVAGSFQFTHMAAYHAGIVIRRTLFRMFWSKARTDAVPWVTYCDPELAHVGLTEDDARRQRGEGNFRILRWPFAENDRARAERATDGFIKIITDRKGRTLGATLVGAHAGELLLPWITAVGERRKMGPPAGVIAPYPTLSEISKRVAGSWYTPMLFSRRTQKIVRFLLRF